MPAMKDSYIVKIAVEMTDQVAQLIEFNQKQPLSGIIQELCNGWNLSDPEQYALQFNENNNKNYITEKNRNEIKNGSILRLQFSPSKTAQDILQKLQNGTPEEKSRAVEKEIPIGSLVEHLQATPVVQQNAVALINALFLKADMVKRRSLAATLGSKQFRMCIQHNILQTGAAEGAEMAHQLYVLQTLMLSLLEQRMSTKMDPQDQDGHDKIKELRRIAFDSESAGGTRLPTGSTRDYKKLGFKNDINPALDFTETPPGLLALDCMIYFARNHPESYIKLVLENSCRADEHECPFGRASVELVKILCELLKIGESPSEQGASFQPLFFTHDHPFEECYCICILLLNKTWKEMRATSEDFCKVASVVREQIVRALADTPLSLDQLKARLQTLTYSEITQLWQLERTSREEWESHARPIVELREQITPEIVSLIKQQRLAFLVEGTRFTKYSTRGQRIKDKFWFMRLSINHKVLHYGDCDEKSTPSAEELPSKLAVSDIRALLTGKDCPHMKGRKACHQLAFSLALEVVDLQSLDCVAPDELTYAYWTDGINALLGNRMHSREFDKDLDTLLSMEIKLRLLDAEGITIPQEPPVVPPEPANYQFCYDLK
ncbi:engulfment and cell motility protein 1 isoform X1 [Coccinella septempunctata]|uniref:engulfment and cell motility protein 1 isoform X1 n=1 Tax=Coccinella septempunctata TaxID=41139 RepID=UPI001D07BA52|nr:engulfment and cell motility protein 1 isoform X1 [Coccinella septempunctata]